jgi:arginine/lysine/ornithine decarboxylase
VNVAGWGVSGYHVADCLRRQEGITAEVATWNNILFALSPFDGEKQVGAIATALERLALTIRSTSNRLDLPPLPVTEQHYTPREAFYHPRRRWLPVKQAAGQTSGETISACPPGIPVLVEGEVISEEVISYLKLVQSAGAYLKGTSDPAFEHIWVVDD